MVEVWCMMSIPSDLFVKKLLNGSGTRSNNKLVMIISPPVKIEALMKKIMEKKLPESPICFRQDILPERLSEDTNFVERLRFALVTEQTKANKESMNLEEWKKVVRETSTGVQAWGLEVWVRFMDLWKVYRISNPIFDTRVVRVVGWWGG